MVHEGIEGSSILQPSSYELQGHLLHSDPLNLSMEVFHFIRSLEMMTMGPPLRLHRRSLVRKNCCHRAGIAGFTSRRNTGVNALSRYGPIPTDPPPMCNDLSLEVTKATDPDFTRLRPRKVGFNGLSERERRFSSRLSL